MATQSPFDTRGSRPIARFGHTMTSISPSKVLLFGGATGTAGKYSITADAFLLDMTTRLWTQLNSVSGTPPSPRAAHAACEGESMQLLVYGGATGGGSLASDDLFMLDLRSGEDRATWTIVPVVGPTPGRRYGHTLCYSKPLILIYGGNTGTETLGDAWSMNVDQTSFSWMKIAVEGQYPGARVYHSAALCSTGPAMSMMVIFGGRSETQVSLNDSWGLRRHRDGRWDWVSAPYKSGTAPLARYQHTAIFIGTHMFLMGGRTTRIEDSVPVEVYDTNTSEWKQYAPMQRFRHTTWVFRGELYVHGGFYQETPNVPTDSIMKIDVEKLMGAGVPAVGPTPDRMEPSRPLPAVPRVGNRTPDIRLASHAIVSIGNGTDLGGDVHGDLVRKVSIDRLQEEGKRLGTHALPPGISNPSVPQEAPHSVVISALLHPQNGINPEFPISRDLLSSLLDECTPIIQREEITVHLRPPIKVFGGLFGQYQDLLRFFDTFGEPSDTAAGDIECFDYLFLGDYVDRGCQSLEVVTLLLALKVKFPDQVTLLRGHHEDRTVNAEYGFAEECASRLREDVRDKESIYSRINSLFEYFPLAAVLDNSILCVHGGIGKSWRHLDQLAAIQRPAKVTKPPITAEDQLLIDVLWSDPTDEKSAGAHVNAFRDPDNTGGVVKFSTDRVQQFLAENQFVMMLRSHECVLEGYDRCAGGKVITLCSSTDYCGKYKNAGAMLVVKRNMEIIPKLLNPVGDSGGLWKNWEEGLRRKPPTPPRLKGAR